MDWSRGFTSRYYLSILDKESLRDMSRVEITEGTVKRQSSGLMESASVTCIDYSFQNEQLVRIWLDVKQDNDSSHIPLFTGLATSPSVDINGAYVSNKLECYSALKPLDDILLQKGWYAPKDIDALKVVENLLKAGMFPYEIATKPEDETSTILSQAILAESGETNLSMIEYLLYIINWRMKIKGDGTISIEPMANSESVIFDSIDNDVIIPTVSLSYDWYNCPNVFRASSDDTYAVARDDDPDSMFSVPTRGREVWAEEDSCSLSDGETLAEYARRRLDELQKVSSTISYDRIFRPDVYVTDIVRLNYPETDEDGNFIGNISDAYLVTDQTISLNQSVTISEEGVRV